jgi:hypothetical protein
LIIVALVFFIIIYLRRRDEDTIITIRTMSAGEYISLLQPNTNPNLLDISDEEEEI